MIALGIVYVTTQRKKSKMIRQGSLCKNDPSMTENFA